MAGRLLAQLLLSLGHVGVEIAGCHLVDVEKVVARSAVLGCGLGLQCFAPSEHWNLTYDV